MAATLEMAHAVSRASAQQQKLHCSVARKPSRSPLISQHCRYSKRLSSPWRGGTVIGLDRLSRADIRRQRAGRVSCLAGATLPLPALLPATSPWGVWAALAFAGAVGVWSERTRWGKELSGPLVSTLVGLALSNLGVIPANAREYETVNKFLLPLAVPLLLFSADLKRVISDTGRLLAIFCIGTFATLVGTVAAWKLLPLTMLGEDGWKIAGAVCARHIGGAINYVGVAETLGMSASAQTAGLAADNLICAIYFTTCFQLAAKIPPDAAAQPGEDAGASMGAGPKGMQVLEGTTAVALATLVCYVSSQWAKALGISSATIPVITALTVLLATSFPRQLQPLVASGEALATILMQIFFATVGACGSIRAVITTAPHLFAYSLIQIAVHLGVILALGKLTGFTRRETLLASNANVGGPTTAAGMAAAKGWRSSLVPALLVGTFGYAIATFIGVFMGLQFRKW